MKKQTVLFQVLVFIAVFVAGNAVAQTFAIPLEGFSRKKTAHLYMEDGSKQTGYLAGFKRAKGLIETVKMQNPDGKKIKIDPTTISYMYLAPSDLAKLGASLEKAFNVKNWESDSNIDTTLMGEGYVYFETVTTQVKKKQKNLMLQLMNPSFSKRIKVYHDPLSNETAGIGIAGVTVTGGLDKSYYVMKVGKDKIAYRLKKKDYDEQFSEFFGDCKEFMQRYGSDKVKWRDLEKHIYDYNQLCK